MSDNLSLITNTDAYTLTVAEEKLLEVLLNPENIGKTVTEKCQIADISRDSYYRIIRKPEFVKVLNCSAVDLIKDKVSEIIESAIKYAVSDYRCHQDRRMLLSMLGVYKEESNINLSTDDPLKAKIGLMSDTEIKQQIQDFLKNNPDIAAGFTENEDKKDT